MDINATFIGQALAFAILIWFSYKFVWPPMMGAIEERQQKIAEGLAAADRSKKDLAQAEEKVAEALREARTKANEIIEQAHGRANQIIDAAKVEAIAEAGRALARALHFQVRVPFGLSRVWIIILHCVLTPALRVR